MSEAFSENKRQEAANQQIGNATPDTSISVQPSNFTSLTSTSIAGNTPANDDSQHLPKGNFMNEKIKGALVVLAIFGSSSRFHRGADLVRFL